MKQLLACSAAVALVLIGWIVPLVHSEDKQRTESPRAADPRLRVDLFAAAPDIVHPISMAFDSRGRLLVIESHTHFRPSNYKGPKHDRVRLLKDTDGDGKADRFTTFFEGTTFTMDIAAHPDGSVYLATRNEIQRLRDTHGDGKADEHRRLIFLETKGNYPHNGLSGLAFDSKGDLYFGLGENLGAAYKLIGADGTTLMGGGEGGGVFRCTADGRKLRRVATGFWNPFGICRDIFGRVFAVDNDPDAMPPCRLVHVVEGGDYGFQFRYGRSGRHPFQSWDGQLPGTLPMMSGTGEAPCEVLSYESDGLPREYVGDLLVTSWADHRVERYQIKERGASFSAERKPFVQGGENFRPVGLAVAPDGSLFVSDWMRSDYNLHGKGSIWHIRQRESGKRDRPTDPRRALFSAHRPLRDAAARRLAADKAGRAFLREQLDGQDIRVRAASLTALIDAEGKDEATSPLRTVAEKDAQTPIRAMAVHALVERGEDVGNFIDPKYPPAVRLEAIGSLKGKSALPRLLKLLADSDSFLRNAAVRQLSRQPGLLSSIKMPSLKEPLQRMGVLLAWRASGQPEATRHVREFLSDPDEDVRFLAVKWIADDRLTDYRPQLVEALKDRAVNVRLFFAYSSALARLDNREVSEARMADYFFDRLKDAKSSPALRVLALQMVPANHPKLTLDLLRDLLAQDNPALRLEAVRSLCDHPNAGRERVLLDTIHNARLEDAVRAQALVGLSGQSAKHLDELLALVRGDNMILRREALRVLKDTPLNTAQRASLETIARRRPESAALVERVLGRPFVKDRPRPDDLDGWLKRLDGPADAATGQRVFFQPKLANCSRCHRVEGRGAQVGPDLSTIGRTERRHILESILRPSNLVPPHYQVWQIETTDGKVRAGMLIGTNLDQYTYLDAKGDLFKLNTRGIVESRPLPTSIMPDGLTDLLTDQELRDLLAYLGSRR
ncbi:MAG TPA: PVC-type heme-binding CxxCH protein [Gemmataceae bacterium]|nr:PVC-type heme-binding CxxCH protein [Gemmataceae bacterium]